MKLLFIVAEEIAKSVRLFAEEEFVMKQCDVLCSGRKQLFTNVSISKNTIAD